MSTDPVAVAWMWVMMGVVEADGEREPAHRELVERLFDTSIPVGTGEGRGVITVTFTGDLDRHRAELEVVWGGPLCIAEAASTFAQVQAAQVEISQAAGEGRLVVGDVSVRVFGVGSGIDGVSRVTVDLAPGGAEATLSEHFGVPIRLEPVFRPVP